MPEKSFAFTRSPGAIHEPPTAVTLASLRYSSALAAVIPPVGQNFMDRSGPEIA